MCDQKCDGPTNAWVVRCLSWKTISVLWFGRDYWHGGHANNSNKTTSNVKYSNCKGLNHETWYQPTKFAIMAILKFVSTSNFISIHSLSIYKLSMIHFVHKVHFDVPASVAQLDAPSDWRPGGRGFNPRRGRQHSFVEIDHEIFSTVILPLPLIQEGQLSVSGERMCTILVNRLED